MVRLLNSQYSDGITTMLTAVAEDRDCHRRLQLVAGLTASDRERDEWPYNFGRVVAWILGSP